MLNGGFLEENAREVDVTREHVTADDFEEFLGCLYPLIDSSEGTAGAARMKNVIKFEQKNLMK